MKKGRIFLRVLQAPGNLAVEAGRGTNVRWSLKSQNTPRNCISLLLYFLYFCNWAKNISSNWAHSSQPAILKRVTMMDECSRGQTRHLPRSSHSANFLLQPNHTSTLTPRFPLFLGLLSPDPDPSLQGFPPIIPNFSEAFLAFPR